VPFSGLDLKSTTDPLLLNKTDSIGIAVDGSYGIVDEN